MGQIQEIFPESFDLYYPQWQTLLKSLTLAPDDPVDHIYGLIEGDQLIGAVSNLGPIIKQVAIPKAHQGGHVFNQLISFIMNQLAAEDVFHYFVYTTPSHQNAFEHLGFDTIAQTDDLVFLEKGFHGFKYYLEQLKTKLQDQPTAAIVMNANPFTLGHLQLIQRAAQENPQVLILLVSAQRSLFTFDERLALITQGTAHLDNVVIAPTDYYLVSNGTFPTYFLKERAPLQVAEKQARLDAAVFTQYSTALPITKRYVGTEPTSAVTEIYNRIMAEAFKDKFPLVIQPRQTFQSQVISASKVRQAIQTNDLALIQAITPLTTYQFIVAHLTELQQRKEF